MSDSVEPETPPAESSRPGLTFAARLRLFATFAVICGLYAAAMIGLRSAVARSSDSESVADTEAGPSDETTPMLSHTFGGAGGSEGPPLAMTRLVAVLDPEAEQAWTPSGGPLSIEDFEFDGGRSSISKPSRELQLVFETSNAVEPASISLRPGENVLGTFGGSADDSEPRRHTLAVRVAPETTEFTVKADVGVGAWRAAGRVPMGSSRSAGGSGDGPSSNVINTRMKDRGRAAAVISFEASDEYETRVVGYDANGTFISPSATGRTSAGGVSQRTASFDDSKSQPVVNIGFEWRPLERRVFGPVRAQPAE